MSFPEKRLCRRVVNFIEFIGNGKGTPAWGQALELAERRATTLRDDLTALESTAGEVFRAPPIEWVAERVRGLQDLLERETSRSALILPDVLGPVILKPMTPQIGKSYYQAETTLQIVDLLHDPEGGSNWLRKWRRGELNRAKRDDKGEGSRSGGALRAHDLPRHTAISRQRVPRGQLDRACSAVRWRPALPCDALHFSTRCAKLPFVDALRPITTMRTEGERER